jgi:alpha/beta superfamily hydrolase
VTPPRAEPVFFGPPARPLAGWLHRASVPASDGLVVCNPFGYEAICAHRALRHFAHGSAAIGIPAFRFDYDGTGDSAGDDRDPDRLRAWVESTRAAARTLRETCGVERIWFLGVRLGVLIAVLAADGLEDVAGIIAIAPVVSGRTYLRELKLLQGALGLAERPQSALRDADGEPGEGGQEALGFAISAETRAALAKVDLTKLARAPAREVLVLDRNDLPGAGAWVTHLVGQHVDVDARQLPGYIEMVLDPHKAEVPQTMLLATTAWLAARRATGPAATTAPREGRAVAVHAGIGGVSEQPVFVDAARHVYGVLTSPRTATASGRAVLLLNAGAIHHVGPNRLYVALARRWAAEGHHVLRLDITGIGDSPARAGETENIVYSSRAIEDISAAVSWLRKHPQVSSVWSIGLCSGAYHALKGAVAGQDVSGIIAINPLTFFWTPDTPLDFPAVRVVQEAERYRHALRDVHKWKKVLRGEVNVRRAIETVGRRMGLRLVARLRDVSRRLHVPWKDDLGVELNLLAKGAIAQRFVFAAGDPGMQLLREQGGSAVATLRKNGSLVIDVIDGPDHTFTPLWSHGPLASLLTAALSPPAR